MPEVLDYLEYREYLKDWFVETKKDNPFTSYRYLGQKTGVDPAWLVRVFQKEGHLNESTLPVFIRICGLDDRRAEYFKTLYRFNKTKAKQTLSELYYKLLELRSLETRVLSEPELAYFGSWACAALRALIGITKDTSDITGLGKHLNPPISQDDARNALGILKQLGLVVPDGTGGWNITDQIISTGGEVKRSVASTGTRWSLRRNRSTATNLKNATFRVSCLLQMNPTCPKSSTRLKNFAVGCCNSPARANAPTAYML